MSVGYCWYGGAALYARRIVASLGTIATQLRDALLFGSDTWDFQRVCRTSIAPSSRSTSSHRRPWISARRSPAYAAMANAAWEASLSTPRIASTSASVYVCGSRGRFAVRGISASPTGDFCGPSFAYQLGDITGSFLVLSTNRVIGNWGAQSTSVPLKFPVMLAATKPAKEPSSR